MDENQIIRFAWGGGGNLINYILHSNNDQCFDHAVTYYQSINTLHTWVAQEWPMRDQWGSNLSHDFGEDGIKLIWDNSLDTSFHYMIKNHTLDHLGTAPMHHKVSAAIHEISTVEAKLKSRPHWSMTQLLQDIHKLHDQCLQINPLITLDRTRTLFSLWRDKTRDCYDRNAEYVLGYFNQLPWQVVDYKPDTIYNILYANTNT